MLLKIDNYNELLTKIKSNFVQKPSYQNIKITFMHKNTIPVWYNGWSKNVSLKYKSKCKDKDHNLSKRPES